MCILTTMTNKAVFRAFLGTVYCTSFRWMERLPGNGSLPGTRFLLAAKESSQRKLPLFRRSGPATKGLHAPKNPKEEVAECAGYANAVLLFALNARALCSVLKFGCSPEPPQGARRPPCQRGLSPLGDWGIPTGYALQPVPGQPPHTAKGRAAALPRPSRPQPIHATLPLPLLYSLHRREGS